MRRAVTRVGTGLATIGFWITYSASAVYASPDARMPELLVSRASGGTSALVGFSVRPASAASGAPSIALGRPVWQAEP